MLNTSSTPSNRSFSPHNSTGSDNHLTAFSWTVENGPELKSLFLGSFLPCAENYDFTSPYLCYRGQTFIKHLFTQHLAIQLCKCCYEAGPLICAFGIISRKDFPLT